MRPRFIRWLAGIALAATLIGCEKGPPAGPPLAQAHPVHGRITFHDQTPLKGGVIYFTPTEINVDGLVRYEAAGLIDAQGRYKLGFNGDEKGAPAGACKVTIKPRDYQELPNSSSKRIPVRYREPSSTPLTVTVKEGDNIFNFEIK